MKFVFRFVVHENSDEDNTRFFNSQNSNENHFHGNNTDAYFFLELHDRDIDLKSVS